MNYFVTLGIGDDNEQTATIKQLLNQLPNAHKTTLIYLISYLRLLSLYSKENKMSTLNLGVIFAPTILRKRIETVVSIYYSS